MEEYFGNRHFYAGSPQYVYLPERSEYPGYDSTLVLGRERDVSFYHDEHYHRRPSYGSYQYYPRSRSGYFPDQYDRRYAHLSWATEIPVRLRVNLCSELCKISLDRALRDLPGVHDVGISGWADAMVTVTGTASPYKILKVARMAAKDAVLWESDPYDPVGHYSYGSRYY